MVGFGQTLANLMPFILPLVGISMALTQDQLDTANSISNPVRYPFYIGAASILLTVLWTMYTTKEYPPENDVYKKKHVFTAEQNKSILKWRLALPTGFAVLGSIFAWQAAGVLYGFIWAADIFAASYAILLVPVFKEILAPLCEMPDVMKQLWWVKFFTWYGLPLMWQYLTLAAAKYAFDAPVTVLYILLFSMVWRRVKVSIREAARATSARHQFSLETLEKISAIRTFGLSDIWHKKFKELSAKESITHLRLQWLGNIGETLAHGLTILASVAVVGFGVHLIWAGQMTAGALVATMILCWRVLTPFYSLCTMVPRLDQLRNSVRQVNELMAINEEEAVGQSPAKGMAWQGVVSFNNVGLRYPGDVNPVFSGLNFTVNPGELALMTGDNGSGKTSLLKMILGMYLPQAGAVQIDHHDIRQMDPQDLRRHIAYIPQYPHFFEGTIDYNLRLAHPLLKANKQSSLIETWIKNSDN